MIENVVIERRFRGPPASGNGGYVCGLLGRNYRDAAQVTLRKPPPLDRELSLTGHGAGELRLMDGDELVAESIPAELDIELPEPPGLDAARAASRGYIGFTDHHFGGCFVCGPDRREGDGLRIFAGDVKGRDLVAAPWTPDASLAGDDGLVRPEYLWAALDCPGYFSLHTDRPPSLMLLGRFVARVEPGIRPGEDCVVIGWSLGSDGRKHGAGTALFSPAGRCLGSARATWIELRR
jgi:hypothetical protein